jgi:hydroxyquinol 1,2-dioxygenase
MLDLDVNTITPAVLDALTGTEDPRTREVLDSLVRHIHDFVREVGLTEAEWARGVDFLTRTGQLCSPTRQEVILLSDVLGVTMLVDAVNHRRSDGATENSVLGPFFREDRPTLEQGADISGGVPGTPLLVRATVVDHAGKAVPGAAFDVWHSDADGHYDSDVPGLDGPAMRGTFHTDDSGQVTFRTVAPASYPIPADGPVGELMRTTHRSVMRPAHVHVRIEAPGFQQVTTMLFRHDDPHVAADPVFGVKRSLLAVFEPVDGESPAEILEHTFVLDPVD